MSDETVTAQPAQGSPDDYTIGFDQLSEEELIDSQDLFRDIVLRYYKDPSFKKKVDDDPAQSLREAGLAIPEGATVLLHFNTDRMVHIVLPGPDQI